MPTVILLDVSLSMCRPSSRQYTNKDPAQDPIEIRQLANVGIGTLLDYLAQNAQLEYTSLLVFSSLWEIRNQFTRNHESIKSGIYELELYDKSNIVNAMRGALSLKLDEWSQNGTINIILVTDGQFYHTSMQNGQAGDCNDDFVDISLRELEGQFDFPCKLQIVCLTSPRDPALKHSLNFFKNLISIVDSSTEDCPVMTTANMKHAKPSAIWLPESNSLSITIQSVENLFTNIADLHYKPYHSVISFGHLSSMVMLSPKPSECLVEPLKNEFDDLKNEESLKEEAKQTFVSALNKVRLFKLTDEINICGFMSLNEIASPAVTSRHLVLPIPNNKFNETAKAEQILSQDPNAYSKSLQTCTIAGTISSDKNSETSEHTVTEKPSTGGFSGGDTLSEQDITKQPSFCILLHNCLKQENMIAICIVGKSDEANEDWYGILHPHIDSRKRSSLMLSLLLPGSNPILWLPNFRSLGSVSLNAEINPSIKERSAANHGPLKSYSSNNVIWLDPESVQADVQKIVRHAKRAPDKAPHFYKELNRIRRAAISYGFYDILSGLASILERERRIMISDQNKPVNQDILKHIDHVILSLRVDLSEESYDTQITPVV